MWNMQLLRKGQTSEIRVWRNAMQQNTNMAPESIGRLLHEIARSSPQETMSWRSAENETRQPNQAEGNNIIGGS
jgi:hypothetical protein